ncbi:MAG: hypothetical protein JSV68_07850, partial [Anaerolineaceae bacterium]
LIVERVYVEDERVIAMTLRSNYHLILNDKTNGPTELSIDPLVSTRGSEDGPLTRKIMVVLFLPRYIVQNHISDLATYTDILSLRQSEYQASISP